MAWPAVVIPLGVEQKGVFDMSDPKRELKEKVTALINQRYGGDWDRAFRHYAGLSGIDGVVEPSDVKQLLKDADIGNGMTRGAWTSGIMDELDTDKSGGISWGEFRTVFDITS